MVGHKALCQQDMSSQINSMHDCCKLKGNARMTPREHKLIQGVADRLRNAKLTEKDSVVGFVIGDDDWG